MKLIVFFSASGVTRKAAEALAAVSGADTYEIIPEKIYTDEDLDWRNKKSRSSVEMQDESSRPAIKGNLPDLSSYDTVYIGFPIWWGVAPRIINTFIEKSDLKGKRIVIFATSGGSALPYAVKDLEKKYPELNIENGKLLNGRVTEDII